MVRVPVLSKITVFIFRASSSWSPPLIKIPFSAPLPVPTSRAAGVAIPNAHGQAIITTETKARREKASPIPAAKNQNRAEAVAISMTDGTKYAETLSANLCNGAFPI